MSGIMERGMTRYPEKIKARAKELFAQGVSCSAIAAQLGVSGDVIVRRWCDEDYRRKYNERAKLRARGTPLPSNA